MEPFAGFEPHVGEILALRTFRIGPGGVLYPLFSDQAWSDGANTAGCRLPRELLGDPGAHLVPDPHCACGFYAYADERAALEYPNARHVLAVVACWGRLIAGTRGVRSQHARIESIWMSDSVPPDLARMVGVRYPGVRTYVDKKTMLEAHPPTVLECYDIDSQPDTRVARRALGIAVAVALLVGLLPTSWLHGNGDVHVVWLCELVLFLTGALFFGRRRTDLAAKRYTLLCIAVVLWLLAPYAGAAGTLLLRLPLIQIATLSMVQRRLLQRAASRFPADIHRA